VERDTEAPLQFVAQIDPPPTHDPVHRGVGTRLDKLGQFNSACCRVVSFDPGPDDLMRLRSPASPLALQRCSQSRKVYRSMPQVSAAVLRSAPSSTNASIRALFFSRPDAHEAPLPSNQAG